MQTAIPHDRTAGALYLIIILCGVWAEGVVRGGLITSDPAATAANIAAGETLFRLGFTADTVMAMADVALAVLLFLIFHPVSLPVALLAAAFRLTQTAILGGNLIRQQEALLALEAGDPATMARLLEAGSLGYDVGLLFFGINCLLTAWLICHSGFLPRWLAPLIGLSGLVYLAGAYIRFLAPGWAENFTPAYLIPLIGETAFCLRLLIGPVGLSRRAPT